MNAVIKNNPEVIIEILGEDADTIAMVTDNSRLTLNWEIGSGYYLYNLDETGDQQDDESAIPVIIEILNENGIAILEN